MTWRRTCQWRGLWNPTPRCVQGRIKQKQFCSAVSKVALQRATFPLCHSVWEQHWWTFWWISEMWVMIWFNFTCSDLMHLIIREKIYYIRKIQQNRTTASETRWQHQQTQRHKDPEPSAGSPLKSVLRSICTSTLVQNVCTFASSGAG